MLQSYLVRSFCMALYLNGLCGVVFVCISCSHMKKNAESRTQVLVITAPVHPAMGKSPAKWIKTVLFGKKTSKSNISKGREVIS
jgi:hypothetical protein